MSNFKNKHVAITGGASFIGSHLYERLVQDGAGKITVIDDLSAGKTENLPSDANLIIGDLREYRVAQKSLKGVDYCFHLASVHGGRGYVSSHDVEISDNFALSTNVFRACAYNNVEGVAFSSSACAYDTRRQQDEYKNFRIPETWDYHDAAMFPDGMYGLEKAVSERVLRSYINAGIYNGVVCRFFTVFGERMNESHFVCASIAKSFIKQNPYYVWGSPDVVRNFTYVSNTVDGLIKAAEKSDGGIYNIASEDKITIGHALEKIWEIIGWRPEEIIYQPEKPVGIRNRVSNSTKAKRELGWQMIDSFETGLEKTINWYMNTHNVEDVKASLEKSLTER